MSFPIGSFSADLWRDELRFAGGAVLLVSVLLLRGLRARWSLRKLARRFLRDESGVETVEFALLLGLISAGLVGVVTVLGQLVAMRFQQLVAVLEEAP